MYHISDYAQYTLRAVVTYDQDFIFKTYVKKNMYQMDVWKKYEDDK